MRLPITQSFPRTSLILILTLILLTLITPASSSAKFASGPNNCQIIGDADVYGLGIRLNFYLQWAAIIFATWIAPEQVNLGRQISNIVAISVYTNTFLGVKNGTLIAAEWWIVYFMTFVLTLGFVPVNMVLKRKSIFDLGFLGVLWCMIVFAECWLWFKGIDLDHKEGCMIRMFLLFEVNVENKKWRTVFQVGSVISCVVATAFLILGVYHFWSIKLQADSANEEANGSQNSGTKVAKANGTILKAGLTVFQLVFGAVAIVQIEMTMKINNIDVSATSLTSSGQLIAFVGSVYTLGAVFAIGVRQAMGRLSMVGN